MNPIEQGDKFLVSLLVERSRASFPGSIAQRVDQSIRRKQVVLASIFLTLTGTASGESVSSRFLGGTLSSEVDDTVQGPKLDTRLVLDSEFGYFAKNRLIFKDNTYKHLFSTGVENNIGAANYSVTFTGEKSDFDRLGEAKRDIRFITNYQWLYAGHMLEADWIRSEGGVRLFLSGLDFNTTIGRETSRLNDNIIHHFAALRASLNKLSFKAWFHDDSREIEERYALAYSPSKLTQFKASHQQRVNDSQLRLIATTAFRTLEFGVDFSQQNWLTADDSIQANWTLKKSLGFAGLAVRASHDDHDLLDSSIMLSIPEIKF